MLTTIFSMLTCITFCSAQTTKEVNALSLEVGKNGLIYNFIFDHKVPSRNIGFRVGIGSNLARYLQAFSVGGGGYFLVGKANRFLELGVDLQYMAIDEVSDDQIGLAFVYPNYTVKSFYPSANIGYRSYRKHTLFRVGFSPGVIDQNFVPGGYLSVGLRF